jgi:hypothetical protein
MTFPPAPPEVMRALWMEVRYDGASYPSVSVPCLDFFGLPHGRPVAYASALMAANEGRGFNTWVPMPFRRTAAITLTNGSTVALPFYYQVDYTLEHELPGDAGYLHVSFRRQNPTALREDFVIEEGLRGPGRFLGCSVGIRVLDDGAWYGEGEVKLYLDGDQDLPTICGTGLEDYVGSAWGMGQHHAPYGGSPVDVRPPGQVQPDFVSFYRWHVPDPIVFRESLRVTIQQIGFAAFRAGEEEAFARFSANHPAAGQGWTMNASPRSLARGICERVDDYCAASFVYCHEPQGVPPLVLADALADIGRLPYEVAHPMERGFIPA